MTAIANNLEALAAGIRHEHAETKRYAGLALDHARAAGDLLLKAKEIVAHGEFGDWIEEHCDVRVRMAQGYMQIASNWDRLIAEAKRRELEMPSTVRGALALLSPARDPSDAPVREGASSTRIPDELLEVWREVDDAVGRLDAHFVEALKKWAEVERHLSAFASRSKSKGVARFVRHAKGLMISGEACSLYEVASRVRALRPATVCAKCGGDGCGSCDNTGMLMVRDAR